MNSSRSVRRVTGSLREFVGIDHGPAELEVALDIVTMTSLRSGAGLVPKTGDEAPDALPHEIEDDPDIAPAFKVPAQLLVPV